MSRTRSMECGFRVSRYMKPPPPAPASDMPSTCGSTACIMRVTSSGSQPGAIFFLSCQYSDMHRPTPARSPGNRNVTAHLRQQCGDFGQRTAISVLLHDHNVIQTFTGSLNHCHAFEWSLCKCYWCTTYTTLECGPMPNVMVARPNIGGAHCSTPQFGWRPLLECHAVTLPRRETHWNYLGCPKLTKRYQPLVRRSSRYCGDM